MAGRFDYIKYDDQSAALQDKFKTKVSELEAAIQNEIDTSPGAGRYKALAITALEEVYCWIGKAIRESQIIRNGSAELQEERKDS